MSSSMYPYKSIFDDKTKEGKLERKKSISLGSLSKYSEKSRSGQTTPASEDSSLTGSYSSIQGQSLEILGEPVVLPPVIALERTDDQKKSLTVVEAKNLSCKVWIENGVNENPCGLKEEGPAIPKPIEVSKIFYFLVSIYLLSLP